MKFLITGAKGQLGQEFPAVLKDFNHEFLALDRNALDITDSEIVARTVSSYKPDVLVNCAAFNLVDKAEEDSASAFRVNAKGVKNLAIACKQNGILLVHYGSDYVFDGTKEDFYREEDETHPVNIYGESKLQGEQYLREETDNHLLFRLSWVFGEGRQNFLYKLLGWSRENRVLKIVCDQVSVPTYTKDVVSLTMFAINRGLRGTYHLTNTGYASRYEVSRYFLERMALDNLVLPVGTDQFQSPARRPCFSAMSNRKLANELNVEIPDWQTGVDRYVESITRRGADIDAGTDE